MRKSLFVVSLFPALALVFFVGASHAAETKNQSVPAAELKATIGSGDVEAGKAASATCAGCHGADGVAAITANPNLAGQGAPYLVKQLQDYKSGLRENAIMSGMANLEQQTMEDIAAYYSSQTPAAGESVSDSLELGRSIYQGGISSIGVPACMSCHSPDGGGNDAAKFPALSGQNKDYFIATMQNFRSGARSNDPNRMMRLVAERLSDREIAALANYVQGLY